VVFSGYPCGIFWLPLWYLLVTSVVSSYYPVVSTTGVTRRYHRVIRRYHRDNQKIPQDNKKIPQR
jgi:hypothetical protein